MANDNIISRHKNRFKAHTDAGKALRDLTTQANEEHPLPKTSNGSADLCLSFHLQGYCFGGCRRKHTHRRLVGPEAQNIDTFLDACGVPQSE